jgi:hypothetical protein
VNSGQVSLGPGCTINANPLWFSLIPFNPRSKRHVRTANLAICWFCYGYVNDVYGANALDA